MLIRKTMAYCLFLTPFFALMPLSKSDKAIFNEILTPETISIDSVGKVTIPNDIADKDYRINKVVIDAGHGGYDSGCLSADGVESKNNLAMALKLGQRIKDNFPTIEVIYTRERDVFIELHRRAQIANDAKADLFISIHCNSTDENSGARGTETYVLGMHKKESNFAVARRENASILLENDYKKQYDGFDPNSIEAYIIFSLFQNAYLDKSILFASYVEESFKTYGGRRSFGVKQAGFMVLKETAMPSVLIETGFLNHPSEGAFISSSAGQETIAESIFLAFQKYKTAVETREMASYNTYVPTREPVVPTKEPAVYLESPPIKETVSYRTPVINNDIPRPVKEVRSIRMDASVETIVFKIQLAAGSRDMSETPRWKNMPNLEVIKEGSVFKYFKTGFVTYSEATEDLKRLRVNGFSDAFIVTYKNGRRVSP